MSHFQHFIITPFNVDLQVWPRERIIGREYVSQRFSIFREVCYSSLKNQSNQNFTWLVFFDEEIPEEYRKQIEILSEWKNFVPVFTKPQVEAHSFSVEAIKNRLAPDTRFLITSRIDTDDALSYDFVELTQQQFEEQNFEFINFPFGYMLRPDALLLRKYLCNPFLSLIEVADDNIVTCRVMSHAKALELQKRGVQLRQVLTHPTWLQVVHESNWENCLDVNASVQTPSKATRYFDLKDFIENHIQCSYTSSLRKFIRDDLIKNKYDLSAKRRLEKIASTLAPSLSFNYFRFASQSANINGSETAPVLSADEARKICLEYECIWRKNQV